MRYQKIDTQQSELFRNRLSNQIDMRHELVRLSELIDWRTIEEEFADKESSEVGLMALPIRLMVGLLCCNRATA